MNLDYILFAQHGWADDERAMTALAHHLITPDVPLIAPCLDYFQTWMRMEPLIQQVEAIALQTFASYPQTPARIIGHSMGGLIWLEVLTRHPDWWSQVHSLVLIACPVGGADLGRIIDPLQLGVGIAADLGKDRKSLAAAIATVIPTLVIAGDIDQGSDGTVTVTCTQFPHAAFVCLPGLSHPTLRNHPAVVAVIRDFWEDFSIAERIAYNDMIEQLRQVPGMTDGHWRDFERSQPRFTDRNGITLRVWRNPLGVSHVFIASHTGLCLYAGFVGWLHDANLEAAIETMRQNDSQNDSQHGSPTPSSHS